MTELRSRGGSGGVHADVGDMRLTAERLTHAERVFARAGAGAGGQMTAGSLLRTTVFSPGTAGQAQVSLGQSSAAAGLLVVGVHVQVVVLHARALLFELADGAGTLVSEIAKNVAAPFVLGGAIVFGTALYLVNATADLSGVAGELLSGRLPLSELDNRVGDALGRAGKRTAEAGLGILSRFPQITEIVSGGLPEMLGITMPHRPSSIEDVLALVSALGVARDRPVRVSKPELSPTRVNGLGGIFRDIDGVGGRYSPSANNGGPSAVRIVRLDGEPPRWVVEIPGTMTWGMEAGGNPSDLTSNVQAMQRKGELLRAISDAMAKAGIQPTDSVMLAGHSQGGIAAGALAADPGVRQRFNVTHVLTGGSPIADMPIPANVKVLSIEHSQDPVPRLEGRDNPDRSNWTTVTRDVGGSPGVAADPIAAHHASLYADTAGDIAAAGGSLGRDSKSFEAFSGRGTAYEFKLQR